MWQHVVLCRSSVVRSASDCVSGALITTLDDDDDDDDDNNNNNNTVKL